ncbi:MAG: succinate dehydrogenase/fumarate reductase iron-sulfur subunit [Candidatus Bathyarchaeia archaeon]
MKIKMKIHRFNPETDKVPYYDVFEVDAQANDRILDCLNKIRWEQDSTLSYRMSCAHGVCGSDAVSINGIPALACQKLVKDYDYSKELVIEPLKYFPVIKDLIVDMRLFFRRIKAIQPNTPQQLTDDLPEKERLQSVDERSRIDDAIKCILCGCCVAACPVILEQEPQFIGPAALLREQKYIFDSRATDVIERMRVLEKPYGIWGCKSYFMCTIVCPKNIKVTEAIIKTKKKIIRELHPETV